MCNEAVDDFLAALKLIPDWFVTSKIIEKLFTALHTDDAILYFSEDYWVFLGILDTDLDIDS